MSDTKIPSPPDCVSWPITLVSADGRCVPPPETVSAAAVLSSCPVLRHAINCGERVCLIPVARASVLELFWEYISLPVRMDKAASSPQGAPSRAPLANDVNALPSVQNTDLAMWGNELSLPYRDAWLRKESAKKRRTRARQQDGVSDPPVEPDLHRAAETESGFSYVLDPLRCDSFADVGLHSKLSETSGLTTAALPNTPFSGAPRPDLATSCEQVLRRGNTLASSEAAAEPSAAEQYASSLIPLLAPLVATDGTAAPTPTPGGSTVTSLASALTLPYDLAEYAPDSLDQHFVRHVVAPHLHSPRDPPRRTCSACASTRLHLTCDQQQALLELIVLAEWLGHGPLYRLCVYTLACWLAQSSVDEIASSLRKPAPPTHHPGAPPTVAEAPGPAVARPTARVRPTTAAKATRRGQRAAVPPPRHQDDATVRGVTKTSRPSPADGGDTLSGEQRIELLVEIKQNPSWLLPPSGPPLQGA